MGNYRPRHVETRLLGLVARYPVVLLSGARRTGKSTLVRHLFAPLGWHFVDLDDPAQYEMAVLDPDHMLEGKNKVVIDEAQRSPSVLRAVQRMIDARRGRSRVVLVSSADLRRMKIVPEPLTRQATSMVLNPLAASEVTRMGSPGLLRALLTGKIDAALEGSLQPGVAMADVEEYGWRGGLVPLSELRTGAVRRWWDAYIRRYVERDVLLQSPIQGQAEFRRTWQACAARVGEPLNMAELAREVGVSGSTVRRYLDLLDITHQLHRLPALVEGTTRRLVKGPRVYLGDAGLTAFLAGFSDRREVWRSPFAARLLRQVVLQHLLVEASTMDPAPVLHHWHTTDDQAVDFVAVWRSRVAGIKVKLGPSALPPDGASLSRFAADLGRRVSACVLLYGGSRPLRMGDRVHALPLRALLSKGA